MEKMDIIKKRKNKIKSWDLQKRKMKGGVLHILIFSFSYVNSYCFVNLQKINEKKLDKEKPTNAILWKRNIKPKRTAIFLRT